MAERILVSGGGGFLGTAICRALRARSYQVVSFSRGFYPHLADLGVEQRRGDVSSLAALSHAMAGCQAVVHTAAKAGMWGPYASFYAANVIGTQNVIQAAKRCAVERLVYTSSPSVVFTGSNITGADESLPYARRFLCPYPATKRLAEELVLSAHGQDHLATVALRPHLIWGPGDPHFLPRLAERAQRGLLRRVGDQRNRVDVIYVDNAAEAHVQALESLKPSAKHAGKAYFLGQAEPVLLWDFVDELLRAVGLPPLEKGLSFPLAYGMGACLEAVFRLARVSQHEPPMTRFLAQQLARSHYFSHAAAARDFGYQPLISTTEGLTRLTSFATTRQSAQG